jgi:hypothetical protein
VSRKLLAAAILLAVLTSPAVRAEPADSGPAASDRNGALVLTAQGASFSLGQRRVLNLAPPSAELRLFRRSSLRWLVPEASLALVVFPEPVPVLGVAARVHPLAGVSYARHLYARGGVQVLAVVDGFDLAIGGEIGAALEHARLVGLVGLSADRTLVGPRLLVLGHLGVGVTF